MMTLQCNVSNMYRTLDPAPKQESSRKSASIAARSRAARQAPMRLLRVLVVDDDRDMADTTSMLLRLWGHNVRKSYGGATGLLMAMEATPDVILLDVAMPTVTGCELVQKLRRFRRFDRTRIVAMSGYVDEIHRRRFERAGFDDFLAKPLELASLEKLLLRKRNRVLRPRRLLNISL